MFCKVCREYRLSYWETLQLPIRVFWFMNYQLSRMDAERDLRALRLGLTTKTPTEEVVTDFTRRLELELGDVIKLDGVVLNGDQPADLAPALDRAGLEELRMMT